MKYKPFIVLFLLIVSCQNKEQIIKDEGWVEIPQENSVDTIDLPNFRAVIKSEEFKSLSLSNEEIKQADALLLKSVNNYNDWAWSRYKDTELKPGDFLINLRFYIRQYEPRLNEDGEKVVFIYGMCLVSGDRWREGREYISDGGKCYFEVEVNLATNTAGKLFPNGLA